MSTSTSLANYEVRFEFLNSPGRALSFPCDANGNALWNSMSDKAQANYLRACESVGREFACPSIRLSDCEFH
jgi:hypothetical protein